MSDDPLLTEDIPLAQLKRHPRNYRKHPQDQIEHLAQSIKEHGVYRNVVVAKDGTILAGHGVVKACQHLSMETVRAVRLGLDPNDPKALKLLAADNEIAHLADVDDRMLTDLLREISQIDIDGLMGTGFDEQMLANMVMVTRTNNEIESFDAGAEWVGMPEYEPTPETIKLVLSFRSQGDKEACAKLLGLTLTDRTKSAWWPKREQDDLSSVRFEAGD